jgi:hypothetical protein
MESAPAEPAADYFPDVESHYRRERVAWGAKGSLPLERFGSVSPEARSRRPAHSLATSSGGRAGGTGVHAPVPMSMGRPFLSRHAARAKKSCPSSCLRTVFQGVKYALGGGNIQ